MIPIDLAGKVALVTGGGQGLGLATATQLYAAGAKIAINYLDDTEGLNRRRGETALERFGEQSMLVAADVRRKDDVDRMFKQIHDRWGRIDIVVNNAAIIRDRTLKKMNEDEWQDVIDTNLSGVYHTSQAAATWLVDGGRIINMASISGVIGFYGQANYSAAKAGVIALTKVLSKELASRRITVNAVAPGVVLTEMGESIPVEVRDQMLAQIPLGRFGQPEEIANAILFLCSNLASYVTGQTLHVNGGWWG